MKARHRNRLEWLRTTYWVVPGAMLLGAGLLAFFTLWLDLTFDTTSSEVGGWLLSVDVGGAREILGTIAGSMIAVAGVVFSITTVALSLASSQFGPRLLNNFIRDPSNKISLGAFTATFLYCLLVLRTVGGVGEDAFIPHIGVTVALLMAIVSLFVLVYFIHHVAASIRASHVVALVGGDLDQAMERLFPEGDDARRDARGFPTIQEFTTRGGAVVAERQGYLQAIEHERLVELGEEHELRIHASIRSGDFVVTGMDLVRHLPRRELADGVARQIHDCFIVGHIRTAEQDIRLHFNRLAEVAVRALSPGINDPYTAITCVDWLGGALCKLATRPVPAELFDDGAGEPCLRISQVRFGELVEAAFSQIRHYGRDNKSVIATLLQAMEKIASRGLREADRAALVLEVRALQREALKALEVQLERDDPIFTDCEALLEELGAPGRTSARMPPPAA